MPRGRKKMTGPSQARKWGSTKIMGIGRNREECQCRSIRKYKNPRGHHSKEKRFERSALYWAKVNDNKERKAAKRAASRAAGFQSISSATGV